MNRINREKGWRSLGILTWNTRISLGLTEQTWSWVLEHIAPLHVILFQEVKDPNRVRNILGDDWFVWPFLNYRTNGCVVALKVRRFTVIDKVLRDNKHGSKHLRHIVALEVHDRRTERPMLFGSLHVDPLGAGFLKANRLARGRHIRQVDSWCRYIAAYLGLGLHHQAAFVGGDVNEDMKQEYRVKQEQPRLAGSTVLALMAGIYMKPAFKERPNTGVKFDDVFHGGRGIKVVGRRSIKIPEHIHGGEHMDHELVHVEYMVRRGEDL
jgi:hypothetical protein